MYLKDQIDAVAKFALAFDAEIRIDTGGVGQVAFDLLKEAGVKVTALTTGKNAERLKPLAKYTCPFCDQVLEQGVEGLACRCGYISLAGRSRSKRWQRSYKFERETGK